MKRIQTLKDSRRSLQMQALLQHQEPSHAGFHTCIRFFVYGHPIQGSRFSFEAFRIFFFTWASATLLHWCSHCPRCGSYPEKIMYGFNFLFVFYLVSGCSFINIGAHKYLCPQVKRDHHPLVCQGGVKCFKDHPRLNLEFTHSCSSQKKVWKLNLGHLPDRLPLQHLGQRFQCWSSARLISPPGYCNHTLIWTFFSAKLTSSNTGTLPPTRPVLPPWQQGNNFQGEKIVVGRVWGIGSEKHLGADGKTSWPTVC